MEYHGKLYCKIGRKYVELKETSADFDNLKKRNNALEKANKALSEKNSALFEQNCLSDEDDKTKMSFKDAPVGARFRYPNMNEIWVKINSYPKSFSHEGNGLIARWNGNNSDFQSFCSFVDEENGIDFNTEIELT